MFLQYSNMSDQPFGATPDPRMKDPNHIESGRTIRLPGRMGGTTSDVPMRNKL